MILSTFIKEEGDLLFFYVCDTGVSIISVANSDLMKFRALSGDLIAALVAICDLPHMKQIL